MFHMEGIPCAVWLMISGLVGLVVSGPWPAAHPETPRRLPCGRARARAQEQKRLQGVRRT